MRLTLPPLSCTATWYTSHRGIGCSQPSVLTALSLRKTSSPISPKSPVRPPAFRTNKRARMNSGRWVWVCTLLCGRAVKQSEMRLFALSSKGRGAPRPWVTRRDSTPMVAAPPALCQQWGHVWIWASCRAAGLLHGRLRRCRRPALVAAGAPAREQIALTPSFPLCSPACLQPCQPPMVSTWA